MSLKETINNDIKTAMKAKDKETLAVLRMIKTAIQAAEIDKKSDLTPEEELTIGLTFSIIRKGHFVCLVILFKRKQLLFIARREGIGYVKNSCS